MGYDQPSIRVTFVQRFWLAFWGAMTAIFLSLSANYFYTVLAIDWTQLPNIILPTILTSYLSIRWSAFLLACAFAAAGIGSGMMAIGAVKNALLRSKARIWREDADSQTFPVVIFALSPPYRGEQPNPVQEKLAEGISFAGAATLITPEDYRDLLDNFCSRKGMLSGVNWQQSLRLLRHNLGTLRRAYVVLSPEAKPHLEDFKALVASILPDADIVGINKLVDRNDYNDITEALDEAIGDALQQNFKLSDICIDTTGGTSVYSAAAMVKALNSDIMLSYFGSFGGDDEGKPIIMNASIES